MKTLCSKIALVAALALNIQAAVAQTFLNGDFENNTAVLGSDQINLSNAVFNTMMPNTFAFGTYGDMDIINTSYYTGGPQKGSWFVAFTGGGTDAISMELSTELITGKRYTITFWDKCGSGFVTQPFQIGVSNAKDAFGTIVYTCDAMPVVGIWTRRTFSFEAPLSGRFITVQLAGAANIGDWAQADNFSFGDNENLITTGIISEGPYCACSMIQVPFTAIGSFGPRNIFSAQLSDKNGNFKNVTEIGNLQSSLLSGSISCTLPCDISSSSKYRIRVVASDPGLNGSDNGTDITINAMLTPTLTIKAFPSNLVKQDQLVTFRYDLDNSGKVISWQWKVNGQPAGTLATFSSAALQDGDLVSLTLLTENACSGNQTITSNDIEMTVTLPLLPSVSIEDISPSGAGKGKLLTFRAYPENGGDTPEFQWMVNGVKSGSNSPVFSSKYLKDGDKITLLMTAHMESYNNRKVISNTLEVTFPKPVVKEKIVREQPKKVVKSHASGVLKHKSIVWSKKGRRFVKVRGVALRKMKKNSPVCLKD